jgi:flagellar biosynthesis/type III secretory pathway protein FliH
MLKEVQRKAFERGRRYEREQVAAEVGALLARLEESVQALDAMRAAEKADAARFAVEIATAVVEELVGSAIRTGAHDAGRLAASMLEEALPGIGAGPIELAVNPADRDALADFATRGAPPAVIGRLQIVSDPALPRAACRLRASGAEIVADPRLRLAAVAARMRAIAEAERPGA